MPTAFISGPLLLLLIIITACSQRYRSEEYASFYSHLNSRVWEYSPRIEEEPFFLVILVDAPHLDYFDTLSFFKSVAKHPKDGSKVGDVGHAWIYLQGIIDGEPVFIEGGHTGETGVFQAPYFDGIMNYLEYGYASPTQQQKEMIRYEPNPIRYLWETQKDGFFQWGDGGHDPTFAAKVSLTAEQFFNILSFLKCYNYSDYALIGNQCTTLAVQVASLAGLNLVECEVTIAIDSGQTVCGQPLRFWEDPTFALFTLATPDCLEKSLISSVEQGRAIYALDWYKKKKGFSLKRDVYKFKKRYMRFPRKFGATDGSCQNSKELGPNNLAFAQFNMGSTARLRMGQ